VRPGIPALAVKEEPADLRRDGSPDLKYIGEWSLAGPEDPPQDPLGHGVGAALLKKQEKGTGQGTRTKKNVISRRAAEYAERKDINFG